jgi:hypothetical protein
MAGGHHEGVPTKLIYLDACALLRPYDDLSQPRVRLESDAVGLIPAHVRTGRLALAVSRAHFRELPALAADDETLAIRALLERFGRPISPDRAILEELR